MFSQGLARGELPESMKASVTRLVHKKDDKRLLKNWRPISLLQDLLKSGIISAIKGPWVYC